MCSQIKYLIFIYKEDLVLNNQQWLICLKTQRNKQILVIARFLLVEKVIRKFLKGFQTSWYATREVTEKSTGDVPFLFVEWKSSCH